MSSAISHAGACLRDTTPVRTPCHSDRGPDCHKIFFVLVTESHRTHLVQELRAQGVDIDGAIERGTCLFFDADVAPDPVRFLEAIDGVRAAAAKAGKAHPRVAFCGERAGRLWAAGRTAEAVQLEQLCGELADDVDILWAYPVPYTNDDQALTRICAEHTAVSAARLQP